MIDEKILYQVNWQIKNDLGVNVYADEIEENGGKCEFRLNLSTPIFHEDTLTKYKTVSYLIFKDLLKGSVSTNKKNKVYLPKIKEMTKKVISRYNILNKVSERIVLNASSDNIAKLNEVDHFLKPISYIALQLYEKNFFPIEQKMSPKMNKYLNLLNDLELIKKVEGGYKESSKFISLKKKVNQFEELKHAIYSDTLSQGYETLRNYFNFRFIDSYIKIENSYYADSVESNRLLKRTEKEMLTQFIKRYAQMPSYKFNPHLRELALAGSFKYENQGVITGINEIYEEIYSSREKEIDFAKILY